MTCTFTNVQRGNIIVKKVTDPKDSTQLFDFEASYDGDGFQLKGGEQNDSGALVPGTYSVSETVPTGWDLTDASCSDGSAPSKIELAAGETVTCTFTNVQRAKIIVKKVTNPTGSSQVFDFEASYDADGFQLKGGEQNDSGALVPGTYSVSEKVPAGWDLDDVGCSDGSLASKIELQAGETVTCTFRNVQRGKIIVKKVTEPTTATQLFTFAGTLAGSIGNGGSIEKEVVPGTYYTTETVPSDWDLTKIECTDPTYNSSGSLSTRKATYYVAAGETVTCTFTNRQRGKAKVIKTVTGNAPAGSQVFTFQLRQNASPTQPGTTLETQVANAVNGGVLSFTTQLTPGAPYQMCEIVMPGWTSTLGTFVPDSFIPPDGIAMNPTVDNSIVCGNFTVTAGETKVFNIDNTPPPGGRALTIGFWKNWASCAGSNGKQKAVLDQVLASFSGGGVYIGIVFVDTCNEAVALLNKSAIDTGKKMSSDPAYNLAAQLMATELNFQAGAGKCGAAITAEQQAQALLTKYKFDGKGSYTSGAKKLSTADATLANQLATTLDKYNNNVLCS